MTLAALIKHGFPYGPTDGGDQDSAAGLTRRIQAGALGILRTFAQALATADANGDLTFEGKGKAKRAAAGEAVAALKELSGGTAAGNVAEKLKRAEEALDRSLPGDTDSPAQAIREMEVRQLLSAMDKTQLHAALRRAAAEGDMLVINAVRNAPAFLQYLPKDTMTAIIGELIARRSPAQAEALDIARDAKGMADKTLADSIGAVTSTVDIDPDTATRIRATAPDNAGGGVAA